MVIANPIYDVVFKRLMENQSVAKFFIETLLEEVVEEVQVQPQERSYLDSRAGLALFRLDFVATIRTANQELKKVLIEIQKAWQSVDVERFRNYLGEQYKTRDQLPASGGNARGEASLPIVSVYLLGFPLPELPFAVVKVGRQYVDLLTHTVVAQKSEFIEKLTHDCFVVQLSRIQPGRARTRLDKLLSVFEQNNFTDKQRTVKEYDQPIDDERIKTMVDILRHASLDPAGRREMEDELEAHRVLKLHLDENASQARLIAEQEQALAEKERALAQQAAEITELKRRLNE